MQNGGASLKIPIVPVDMDRDDALFSGGVDFGSDKPEVLQPAKGYDSVFSRVSKTNSHVPVMIADVVGLRKNTINEVLIKKLKKYRRSIWFLTFVSDTNDVFDAFNTGADTVVFPYHAVKSDYDLSDIISVSNSVIPALFVKEKKIIGIQDEVDLAIENLSETGFTTISVFDTDGSVGYEEWRRIMSDCNVIPYSVRMHESVFEHLGADTVFTDVI